MAKYKRKLANGGMTDQQYSDAVDQYIERSYNGNPVTDNSKARPNYGQYVGYAQAGLGAYSGIQNAQKASTDQNLTPEQQAKYEAQGYNSAVDSVASVATPWYGLAKQGSGMVRGMINKDPETGRATSNSGQALDDIATPEHEALINNASRGNYGAAALDLLGLGTVLRAGTNLFGGGDNPDSNWNQAIGNYAYGGKMRGRAYCANGGELTQYEGFTHEQGGLPLGQTNEVEAGETRGPSEMMSIKDYIYSDRLKVPGKKYTFAKASKMIESKLSRRDNDKLSDEVREKELTSLMNAQEEVRMNMVQSAFKKAYGGELGDPTSKKIDTLDSFNKEVGNYKKIDLNRVPGHVAKYVSEAITPYLKTDNAALDAALRKKYNLAPEAPITGQHILSYDESNKALSGKYNEYLNRYNAYNNYRSKTELEPRVSPNPSVPSFGYETPKPVYDSIKSNVFAPYKAPQFGYGGRMKYDTGSYLQPMEMPVDPDFNPYIANKASLDEYANMVDKDIASGVFNTPNGQYTNGNKNEVIPQAYNGNPQVRQGNNFDSNSLYNVGNFLGSAYDIYRGAKGGDPVDYERVSPENVDYSVARDAITGNINQSFQNNKKTFKNVNNAGQYLSLVTQGAANRDTAISDAISQSYENERNTNAQINNQAKYFNAQTQSKETDARQLEKDVASNTLSTGLYNAGLGLTQMGRDKKSSLNQDQAKKLIGTGDYTYVWDNKGRVKGIKFNKTGEVTPIQ